MRGRRFGREVIGTAREALERDETPPATLAIVSLAFNFQWAWTGGTVTG